MRRREAIAEWIQENIGVRVNAKIFLVELIEKDNSLVIGPLLTALYVFIVLWTPLCLLTAGAHTDTYPGETTRGTIPLTIFSGG